MEGHQEGLFTVLCAFAPPYFLLTFSVLLPCGKTQLLGFLVQIYLMSSNFETTSFVRVAP